MIGMTDNQLSEHSYSGVDVLVDGEKIKSVQEIIVLPADECKTMKLGWLVYEKIGGSCITKSALNTLMGRKRVRVALVE
jgi:hypothetical protein